MKKWGKTGQFRHMVRDLRKVVPPGASVTLRGTVKVHGTNAGVRVLNGEVIPQSRTREISTTDDNFGFAEFVKSREDVFLEMAESLGEQDVTFFGEWAGEGIQSGVAVSNIPRTFFIFAVVKGEDECAGLEAPLPALANELGIYNIGQFDRWTTALDPQNPGPTQNKISRITEVVEALCPVGQVWDVEGVGEGVVWSAVVLDEVYRCKVKGEKHSVSKVKTLAALDPEKLKSVEEFVSYAVTYQRLEQGAREMGGVCRKRTGDFVRWVHKDVESEEADTLKASGLTYKDVSKAVGAKASRWWLSQ